MARAFRGLRGDECLSASFESFNFGLIDFQYEENRRSWKSKERLLETAFISPRLGMLLTFPSVAIISIPLEIVVRAIRSPNDKRYCLYSRSAFTSEYKTGHLFHHIQDWIMAISDGSLARART